MKKLILLPLLALTLVGSVYSQNTPDPASYALYEEYLADYEATHGGSLQDPFYSGWWHPQTYAEWCAATGKCGCCY